MHFVQFLVFCIVRDYNVVYGDNLVCKEDGEVVSGVVWFAKFQDVFYCRFVADWGMLWCLY